ncbi:MAG TPA: hypothetical protein ENN80_03780, partial [Candidatus Hydrogenedentes bacterium]|nr:hypothetical protein [Candidatus Hydrogenedentota bacterium]
MARSLEEEWLVEKWLDSASESDLLADVPFRLSGSGGTLEVKNVVGDTHLYLDAFSFDMARLSGAPSIAARLTGLLGGSAGKCVDARLEYSSLEDFDLRIECDNITAEDVNVFLPARERLIESGTASPRVRITGYPGKAMVLWLETPFHDLVVRDQPDFLGANTGSLKALAGYDLETHIVSLTTAKADTGRLAGVLDGTVSFAESVPSFDLKIEADHLPESVVLDALLEGDAAQEYGLDLSLKPPCKALVRLRGTSESPVVTAVLNVSAGEIMLHGTQDIPKGRIEFGEVEVAWDSEGRKPAGVFRIVDGSLEHEATGLRAERIAGLLDLTEGRLTCDPINALVTDRPFVGSFSYGLDTSEVEFTVNGDLVQLEHTVFSRDLEKLRIEGSAMIRCAGRKSNGRYVLDGEIDATQARIAYDWWFDKPAGIGATAQRLHIEMVPHEVLDISAGVVLSSSPFVMEGHAVHDAGGWVVETFECTSDRLDVAAGGRCLRIPYTLSGGYGENVRLAWQRVEGAEDAWTLSGQGVFDRVACFPEASERPLRCTDLDVSVVLSTGAECTGRAVLKAKEGRVPPFGETWFLPLRSTPSGEVQERTWTYDLSAEQLEAPPWKGTDFIGIGYRDAHVSGLTHFEASVEGGGRIEGSYHGVKADNAYDMQARWTGVPARYFVEHIGYPDVLRGESTGSVDYSLDRDDPGTLKGKGSFKVAEGRFSADFLLAQFQEHLENDVASLPPSLRFSRFEADVALERDRVETPRIELVSEGISMTGAGHFIRDGDMDYTLHLSVTPEAAQRIEALSEVLNVE